MSMSVSTGKLGAISALILAGAATLLFVQHQSILRLKRDNQSLEQLANQLTQVAADNLRLSNLVAQASGAQALSDAQEHELLKLRGEVGRLRQQDKDLENVRAENSRFRAAQAKQNPSGTATTEAPSAN